MESACSMFDVQNIYGTPQIPRKRPCLRPRRMTLIDLRNVPLTEEDAPQRKSSSGTIRSEGGALHCYNAKQGGGGGGILPVYDSTESLESRRSSSSSMRIRYTRSVSPKSVLDGTTRFPKLEECAHFHYDFVELGPLEVHMCEEDRENYRHNEEETGEYSYLLRVSSNNKEWNIRRTYANFRMLDRQLHKCIYDRRFSHLPEIQRDEENRKTNKELERLLRRYLNRFSEIAGSMLNCGSVLNWLEIDNRGNRLLAVDDSGINTPAIAAAHAIKRYNAQAVDEISLEVGDIVSVIDMPPPEDTIWWRGKRGFEVGFFPSECVEVIGDKVPQSMASRIPPPPASKKPLIRKHGKLISFLRTFFSTRPARNQLKQSGIVKERVFGCDLGEHLLNSGHDVPLVLKSCTEVIERHGIVDGIFRLSGITSNIQKLRLAFDEDRVPDLTADCYLQDIHSISSLLKMYFRELPNPLLTYQLYDKFAEAVRDEDNKLLRIHDVVQQLPPPHYRTTEYLMRHLARVAGFGHETGMHSKNLAIVWAPNLLRSKELEMGGGAAALQGVGIQAVVTECLICYCDIIFSDKMPSYSSPELQKSHKKPRPKSLAISTPTRLLSLEEARERAFVGGLNPNQRYIDVGGGPDNLPAKYHTVIDLPGYRKKNVTNAKDSVKGKKSPVSGWKSFFSKPRSGSIRKSRKSSIQGDFADSVSLGGPRQAKALTEEDVHNWKKRLRSAKSAESLLSLASSSRSSSSRTSKANDNLMVVNVYGEEKHPSHHKRSLSSDATAILYHHSHDPSFHDGVREMPIDVDLSVTPDDLAGEPRQSRKSRSEKRTEPERKQSFIRGDSTRRALHRRTPSAPSTPQQERSSSGSRIPSHHKTASQPALESPNLRVIRNSDFHSSQESLDEDFVYHRPDQAHGNVKFVLRSENQVSKHVDSKSSSKSAEELTPKKRCAKTPPKGRKKARGNSGKNVGFASSDDEVLTLQLPESPGARRKVQSEMQNGGGDKSIPAQYFYSRHHDYAEILSDGENNSKSISDSKSKETLIMGSPTSMSDLIQQLDDQFTAGVQFHLYSDRSVPNNTEAAPAEIPDIQPCPQKEEGKTAPVVNIKTESLPKRPIEFREVGPHECKELRESETYGTISSEIQTLESSLQKMQQLQPQPKMSKCLSVPSDIAKSLENVNVGSQSDLLSSVTISELSQSVDSFNLSLCDDSPSMSDARRRRSASLDSLTDSPLSRTLREINLQIDNAFKRDVERALELEDRGYERHQSQEDFSPLHITEDLPTPTNPPESDFSDIPEYARIDKIKSTKQKEKSRDHNNLANGHETRSLPSEDIEIVSGNVNMACIPKTNSASDLDKCVMAPSPRKVHHKNEANNNEKQSYVDRQAEIHIVETPRVLRAPLRPPKQDGSESQMANIRARQESSSSSSESSDSTSDSEDDSESSVEIVCQQNSHPVNVAVAVNNQGQGYTESHLPECGSVNTAVRNSSPLFAPGIVGYISPTHQQTDIGIETLQWRQSPIFSDSGNQFGGASNRTSLARTSPVSSSCATSPAHIYGTSSASSVETSPRLSPRASPNFVTGIQETKMSPSADRLAPPEDHYHGASGGSPGLPVTSPHSSQQSLVEQNPVYYPPHFGSGFVANLPGNFHTSPSLPQVHVIHDTVTLEKPTIKRSTTESKLADRSAGQPLTGEYNEENYSSRTFPRKDSERKHNKRTPFQQQCDFSDHSRDKKCSKLTDVDCSIACQVADTDFHSQRPSSQLSANTVDYSIHSDCFSSNMPSRKDAGSDIVDTQSSHTSASFTVSPMLGCVHSSSQVMEVESSVEVSTNHSSPTVVESTYEKSEIQTSGPSVEAKMFRVESYGNVEPEVFQNAVNSGKELMMSKLSPNCSDIPNDQQKSQGSPVSVLVAAEPPTTSTCRAECKELSNAKNRNMSRKSNIPIPQPRGRARSPQAMHEQAPPNQEVMEVKRPTLKKRGQSPTSFRQDHIERTVVVKEITSEKGEAKLVIERRPNLKRNIQMVHARKVPHPPRQLAEAVDDMSDSVTPDLSSTGPSDPEPSGISSQEDEVFSDINDASSMQKSWHGYKSPRQDEHDVLIKEAGGMVQIGRTLAGKSGKPFKPTPKQFDDMIGSRSSLDESVLQLAAERHDTFGTDDSTPGNQGEYSTGSLRIKRSQKMQSLMDLFEKGSDQNLTLSSSPTFQVQESRLTSSLPSGDFCRLERDQDTDDESFLPVSRSNLPVNRRSRSRDRAQKRGAVGSDKENRLTSRSPTPNRHRPAMADRLQGTDSSTCPSSPAEVAREYRTKRKEKYSNFSKPPRYRSSSRGRTQSESSTSESEGSHYLDGSFHSRSSDLNASSGSDSILRDQNRSDTRTTHDWVERRSRLVRKDSDEGPPEQATVQRRGSIKELMDYFESKQYEQGDEESESTSGSTSTSTPTPTPTERRITRNRIRSVSPGQELVAPRDGIPGPGFRFSLELPSNAAMSLSDGAVKTQPLRLGPKPFYGSKK